MSYKPFPKQESAIDKMVKFLNSKTAKKGIFVYPTSFGKSVVIANVAQKFPEKYFINIVPKKELLAQNYEKYTSYGFEASICSASFGSDEVSKVTFSTVGTLKKHLNFFKDKDVVILIDECHVGSLRGSQLDKFQKGIKRCKLVGTSATPLRLKSSMGGSELRMMNRMRDCLYSSIEDVVQIKDMVDEGKWSKLIYEVEDVDESFLQLNTTGTDFTVSSLKRFSEANGLIDKCVAATKRLREEGRNSTLVYLSSIDEAEEMARKLDFCEALHSKLNKKDRDRIVKDFREGRLKTIANIGVLIEGFDYPLLSSIIHARPTNSITIWYQSLGRGVRVHINKKDCKIVDISGNFNKFGKIEDITFENHDWCGGWAAFSGDRLLTNYPLNSKIVPTKQSLQEAYERKQRKEDPLNPVFNFGQFKNKHLMDLLKDKTFDYKSKMTVGARVKNYIHWIVEEDKKGTFTFYGAAGELLKKAIYQYLKLPIPQQSKEVIKTKSNYFKIPV